MKGFTTVCVTVHDRENFLPQCLDSIISQTVRDIEIVCVDDASTDSCPDILRHYAEKDARIRLCLLKENVGVQRARNKAVEMARGEYILFVDDDDWLSDDCVERCMESFRTHPDAECVLIPDMRVRVDGTMYSPEGRKRFESITGEEAFMYSMPWHISGCMCARTDYQRKFPFDNACRYFGDENTGRLMLLMATEVVMSEGTYFYRINDGSICRSLNIGHYSRLHAQLELAHELQKRGVKEKLRKAYETFCWGNVVGAYMRYYIERKAMTIEMREEALRMIRTARSKVCFELVDKSLKCKFGFLPLRRSWALFRVQEEVYFTLRTLCGRMSLDMD